MKIIPISETHSVLDYPDDIIGVFVDLENKLRIEIRPLHMNRDEGACEDVADEVEKIVKKLKS